jgi:transposase
MDASNSAVIDAVSSRKALPPAKRQYRSAELKRRIVKETLEPGASVARVARAHGVNANQVFAWRRQYQRGLLKPRNRALPGLLAVRLMEGGADPSGAPMPRSLAGVIQVELPQGQLRVTGAVDPEALRLVLKELLA